jgi:ABC-type transport system involved in multi-copper enzyme maturation permease subunit
MSGTIAPYRSDLPTGRDGFTQLLWAEWTKFRTVRGWMIGTVVAALVMVLVSLFAASGSHVGTCDENGKCIVGGVTAPLGPDGEAVADTFYFVHQPLEGDGSITIRVTSLTGVIAANANAHQAAYQANGASPENTRPGLQPWAKAGIIVQESTIAGSSYAAIMVTGEHGVRMQDNYTHDTAGSAGAVSAAAPRWLRLTRSGDTLTGYESPDGVTWSKVGTVHLSGLPATVQSGLFVASPVDSQGMNQSLTRATASFDHLSLQGNWPSNSWSRDDIGGGPASNYPTLASGTFQQSGGAFTVSGSGDIAPAVRGGMFGASTIEDSLGGGFAGLIVMTVVATLFITSEYRRGLIRTTLAASPRRGQVLVAKAIVIGAVAFVVGLVAAAVGVPLGEHILRSNGNFIYPVSLLTELRVVVGTAALLAVAAILALALGTVLRRAVGVVTVVIVLLVVPSIVAPFPFLSVNVAKWLFSLSPAAGFAIQQSLPRYAQVSYSYILAFGYYPLAPWAGFGVLCAYAVLCLGVATFLLQRRDA